MPWSSTNPSSFDNEFGFLRGPSQGVQLDCGPLDIFFYFDKAMIFFYALSFLFLFFYSFFTLVYVVILLRLGDRSCRHPKAKLVRDEPLGYTHTSPDAISFTLTSTIRTLI